MIRSPRFLVAAIVACLLLLGLSVVLRSWGGLALLVMAAVALLWYRSQVAEGEAAEPFFGDMGEETRLTNFQAGSPSELPMDRPVPGASKPPPPAPR